MSGRSAAAAGRAAAAAVRRAAPAASAYWPPRPWNRSRMFELPSGKKAFVFNVLRDEDGEPEPALVFLAPNLRRICSFTAEEVEGFKQLVPRLRGYMDLFEVKGDLVRHRAAHQAKIDPDIAKASPYSPATLDGRSHLED